VKPADVDKYFSSRLGHPFRLAGDLSRVGNCADTSRVLI
jgi:hypothetical protein